MLPHGTPLNQNCWVVPDLETAMRSWIAMGVGPFYHFAFSFPEADYRGRTVPLAFKVALAQAGPIQIELIEQTSPGPSCYRDVVPEGQSGFRHVCKITDDYARDVAALKARGIMIANEFISPGNIPACYADTREEIGCMFELVPDVPILRGMGRMVADGATNWDGTDPIRIGADHIAPYLQPA